VKFRNPNPTRLSATGAGPTGEPSNHTPANRGADGSTDGESGSAPDKRSANGGCPASDSAAK